MIWSICKAFSVINGFFGAKVIFFQQNGGDWINFHNTCCNNRGGLLEVTATLPQHLLQWRGFVGGRVIVFQPLEVNESTCKAFAVTKLVCWSKCYIFQPLEVTGSTFKAFAVIEGVCWRKGFIFSTIRGDWIHFYSTYCNGGGLLEQRLCFGVFHVFVFIRFCLATISSIFWLVATK